ncbi:unnamed protein product [Cuscuta epithymum]|uniref:Uncharacterized protein n=1 Tax=Cuscuta epithymum TaxID=186058 RepID=A0AAV0CUP3_9ASTE|nr:unnamed protein product [Cuscuta epithymum]
MAEEKTMDSPPPVSDATVTEKSEPKEIPTAVKKTVAEWASFKEESNKVEELPSPEKKALDEFKQMVREALNNHEFTPKPVPPPAKEETKPGAEPASAAVAPAAEDEPISEEKKGSEPEERKDVLLKVEEGKTEELKETLPPSPPPPQSEESETPVEVVKETVAEEAALEKGRQDNPSFLEEPEKETQVPPLSPPEEVSIWGIPLLEDERSDVILLKFLRARDFRVKDAFAMLKSVIAWRSDFKTDQLLKEEELGKGLEKVVYMHGVDREGHAVCYNALAEFQDKELYQTTFADKENLNKFLRWRIQFMEKSIRNLDFSPEGINTFMQVIDLKNSPGLVFFKKELRQATNRALHLLQDNYPEFVAKQVFINVPWWYPAYYKMINALFTTRTQSKFVFVGPSKSAETLFKYVAPEQVPVQYGGLSREGDYDFTTRDPATEEYIKPTCKHTVEFPVTEKCTLVWEARVIGWDVSYGSEFVPDAEGAYTVIVEKPRKIGPADETIISNTYKTECAGKLVLTFDNQTSKRKKLLFRSKTKPSK